MNISIEHIGLPAKDSVALKAWYERVLGAKHLWDNGQHPPTCLLSLGGAWVEIYPATSSRPETADNKLAGFRHLALRVASLDAAKSELEKRGVKSILQTPKINFVIRASHPLSEIDAAIETLSEAIDSARSR